MKYVAMGLFDYIKCNYPLPDNFTGNLQTKDFGCELVTHVITNEGRLLKEQYDLNFHGILNFYGNEKKNDGSYEWHEYNAKFTDGQLVNIEILSTKDYK